MQLVVDMTRCQSYAQCCFLAPNVFRFHGQEALVYDPAPDAEQRARVLQAAAACPVQAITVDREDDPRPPAALDQRQASAPLALGSGATVVIVGASLAGLHAAEALRREGFEGRVVIVGEEKERPYDRPPLSKQVLSGGVEPEHTGLPQREEIDAEWRLGVAATGLDRDTKQVLLADGEAVPYDRVLICTGTRARPWPDVDAAALDGVHTLRTADDARRLRERLAARPQRVLVVGGGFTGSEVASSCRELDLPVTVVARGPGPLAGALGGVLGRIAADVQREHGVDVRCRVGVTALEGNEQGRLCRARLSDGSLVDTDVAVVATGAVRNVDWLDGSGLSSGAWGVTSDAGCRAFDLNGVVTDDVFVAGDVARFPHPLFSDQFLAMEHWGNAVAQAQVAAHNMVTGDSRRWAHLSVPVFWSIQFGHVIRSVGIPALADEVLITQGSVAERSFVAVFGKQGRIVGAAAMNQPRWLEHYRREIAAAASFPPPTATVDAADTGDPVPAEMPTADSPWVVEEESTLVLTGHEAGQWRARWRTTATDRPNS